MNYKQTINTYLVIQGDKSSKMCFGIVPRIYPNPQSNQTVAVLRKGSHSIDTIATVTYDYLNRAVTFGVSCITIGPRGTWEILSDL